MGWAWFWVMLSLINCGGSVFLWTAGPFMPPLWAISAPWICILWNSWWISMTKLLYICKYLRFSLTSGVYSLQLCFWNCRFNGMWVIILLFRGVFPLFVGLVLSYAVMGPLHSTPLLANLRDEPVSPMCICFEALVWPNLLTGFNIVTRLPEPLFAVACAPRD